MLEHVVEAEEWSNWTGNLASLRGKRAPRKQEKNISPFITHKIMNHQLPIKLTFARFELDMHMVHALFFHS